MSQGTAGGGAGVAIVEITADDDGYALARELRYEALYRPWGLPRRLVDDADERCFVHFVALDAEGRVVGYARLHLEGGGSKVYQVSVAQDLRGEGIGGALMDACMDRARAEGRDFVELDAREYAIGFYERLGFITLGDMFLSPRTGTPHRTMRRAL